MYSRMKNFFLILLSIFALLLTSCGMRVINPNTDQEELAQQFCIPDSLMKNITLDTVKAEYVMSDLKLSGKITFNEDNVVKVFPQVSGHVGEVMVSLGDFVQKG